MKPGTTSRKRPAKSSDWEDVIARAPGKDRALTPNETAQWKDAVVVKGGGYATVREAVAAKRKPRQRGPQVSPTKQLVSVRYSAEVLEFFRAGGEGWQTRMDEALKQWVAAQPRRRNRTARATTSPPPHPRSRAR
jgi:uncharacterized protein (DUF4415 family)